MKRIFLLTVAAAYQSVSACVEIAVQPQCQTNWPVFINAKLNDPTVATHARSFVWTFYRMAESTSVVIIPDCAMASGLALYKHCIGPVIAKSFSSAGDYIAQLKFTDARNMTSYFNTSLITVSDNMRPAVKRREIRTLALSEWQKVVEALYTLKRLGIYDILTSIHTMAMKRTYTPSYPNCDVAHGGPSFLPWHRAFTRILERALQDFSNDTSISIPYWDWTIDSTMKGGALKSSVWSDELLGPNGNTYTYEVESGPFCGRKTKSCLGRWTLEMSLGGPVLKRRLGAVMPQLPDKNWVKQLFTNTLYDQAPYNNKSIGFRSQMEGWSALGHNSVHQFIGGAMATFSSPNDPIFYLHHAFVDKLWTEWQAKRQCYSDCYQPNDSDVGPRAVPTAWYVNKHWRIPGQHPSDRMWPWHLKISDMLWSNYSQIMVAYH